MTPGVISIIALAVAITAGFVNLARIVTDNQTRRRLAEKGMSAEEIRTLLSTPRVRGYENLRLALLLVPIGAALMVAQYLPFDSRDPFTYGLVLLSAGAGLLVYQLLVSKDRRDPGEPGEHGDG